jgi:hypothetical protein
VRRAPPARVDVALARLAAAGDNDDLARRHAAAAAARDAARPEAFELLALLADRAEDADGVDANADRAIALGSQDANVYAIKAFRLMEQARTTGAIDAMLPPRAARAAADLFDRSIELAPRNRMAYQGLASALLNVANVTPADDAALAAGLAAFPTDGLIGVAQAAVQHRRGQSRDAVRSLRRASAAPCTMPAAFRPAIAKLYDAWVGERVQELMRDLGDAPSVAEARAFLDEQLADASLADRSRAQITGLRGDVVGFERIHAAGVAGREGRVAEARAILAAVASDANASAGAKALAERVLAGDTL